MAAILCTVYYSRAMSMEYLYSSEPMRPNVSYNISPKSEGLRRRKAQYQRVTDFVFPISMHY